MTSFEQILKSRGDLIEQTLTALFSDKAINREIARPERLMQAIRHSSLGGGKRLRPFLVTECAGLFGLNLQEASHAAAALECIHCYSLVHDDLPAMDDDDLRRGKPTTHIAFDEATAILAGDALLTFAFDILAREETHPDPKVRIDLVRLYATSAGLGGMAGGQMLDLEAESKTLDAGEISKLQSMKTGALIRCACVAGGILGNADNSTLGILDRFGDHLGKAFQLADDILDVTSSPDEMGKQTGKDADKGKGTLVELMGLENARALLQNYRDEAIQALSEFDDKADILRETAKFVVERKS